MELSLQTSRDASLEAEFRYAGCQLCHIPQGAVESVSVRMELRLFLMLLELPLPMLESAMMSGLGGGLVEVLSAWLGGEAR
ncbi:hypothetical protein AC1031_015801 [Aphanomyces cochlioides]|nr:hypothetical protein AC1031_015801 [Aphanomyces cochlioides]